MRITAKMEKVNRLAACAWRTGKPGEWKKYRRFQARERSETRVGNPAESSRRRSAFQTARAKIVSRAHRNHSSVSAQSGSLQIQEVAAWSPLATAISMDERRELTHMTSTSLHAATVMTARSAVATGTKIRAGTNSRTAMCTTFV